MRVKCIQTAIDELHGNKMIRVDYGKDWMLRPDAEYPVYAISLWANAVSYLLVAGQPVQPFWYPAQLFAVVDATLFKPSYFSYGGKGDARGLTAVWGYQELVLDFDHYESLIERKPGAIEIFLKRKREIDEMAG